MPRIYTNAAAADDAFANARGIDSIDVDGAREFRILGDYLRRLDPAAPAARVMVLDGALVDEDTHEPIRGVR